MNLRPLDQRVLLFEGEAHALLGALQGYLHQLAVRSTARPVPLQQALRIKPAARVIQRLSALLPGAWSRPGRAGRRPTPRARALRLEYDELLVLLALYQAGELPALLPAQADALQVSLGKLHQQAQNLSPLFAL